MENEYETKKEFETVNPERVVGEVQLENFDPTMYMKEKTRIESVEIRCRVFGKTNPKKGYFALLRTESVGVFNDNPVTATKILGLMKVGVNESGFDLVGWGSEHQTAKFMRRMGCKKLGDLVGRSVLTTVEVDKEGKQRLTFIPLDVSQTVLDEGSKPSNILKSDET